MLKLSDGTVFERLDCAKMSLWLSCAKHHLCTILLVQLPYICLQDILKLAQASNFEVLEHLHNRKTKIKYPQFGILSSIGDIQFPIWFI